MTEPERRDLSKYEEDELLDFIRETVGQLNKLADRLEVFAIKYEIDEDKRGGSSA